MKLKQLETLCAKSSSIRIYQREGSMLQYIGNGIAAYPVPGLPEVDEKTVTVAFDIPEKKRADYYIKKSGLPTEVSFEDCEPGDELIEKLKITVDGLVMFKTPRGMLAIDGKYIKPIADAESIEYYTRPLESGAHSDVIAKEGFDLLAVIMPVEVREKFCEELAEALTLCRMATATASAEPAEPADSEQTTMM